MASTTQPTAGNVYPDEPYVPSAEDQELARRGKVVLLDAFRHQREVGGMNARLVINDEGERHEIELPEPTARLILNILDNMAQGRPISLTPHDAEVSTQVAADILNVSRPFVIKLIENGTLQCRRVGSHRRLRMADVLAHKRAMEADFEKAASELTEMGQELGGYA